MLSSLFKNTVVLTAVALLAANCSKGGDSQGGKEKGAVAAKAETGKEGELAPKAGVEAAEGKAAETAAEQKGETAGTPAVAPLDLGQYVKEIRRFIPDNTQLMAVIDMKAASEIYKKGFPYSYIGTDSKRLSEIHAEIMSFVRARSGQVVTKMDAIVAFGTADGGWGVMVKGKVEIDPSRPAADVVGGFPLLKTALLGGPNSDGKMFLVDGYGFGFWMGTSTVQQYLQLVGADKLISDNPRWTALLESIDKRKDSWFALSGAFSHPLLKQLWAARAAFASPDFLTVHFTRAGLSLEVKGNSATLDGIEGFLKMIRTQAKSLIDKEHSKAMEKEITQGMVLILIANIFDATWDLFTPKRAGDLLTLEVDLDNWKMLPVVAGFLGGVAIPELIKYLRKDKIAEAMENLDRIYKGAAEYFTTPHYNEEGQKLPCHFPPATVPTPAVTCCPTLGGPDKDGDEMCDANPKVWKDPSWSALQFAIDGPHWFVYEFRSNGKTGNEAKFDAIAYGDLDCDGSRSTYIRQGRGKDEGGECSVEISTAIYRENDAE